MSDDALHGLPGIYPEHRRSTIPSGDDEPLNLTVIGEILQRKPAPAIYRYDA